MFTKRLPRQARYAVTRHTWHKPSGPTALARSLAWLRICAVAGQSVAVWYCAIGLQLPIPLLPLMMGICMLAAFAMLASWRVSLPHPVSEAEAIVHVTVDILVLAYLLYSTGGAGNPFVTLLLVPIALSAAALSGRGVLIIAALAGLAYLLLLRFYIPLETDLRVFGDFSLYVMGLGVNFIITTLLLGFFIHRLARSLRLQQQEIQRIHERVLRDEGILAIATQAAGAAHELNTPLSTMRTLLPELKREHGSNAILADDLDLLQSQVERCRTILREMVAFGKAQLSQETERLSLHGFVQDCLKRLQLLRPEAELEWHIAAELAKQMLRAPPGLRHALLNLLNNAVDASMLNGSHKVKLTIHRNETWLEFIIDDWGPGFSEDYQHAILGHSDKQSGLGLGLALTEATAERLHGQLFVSNGPYGAQTCLRLPFSMITT